MAGGVQECDFCKADKKTEDLRKCAYCGRLFCENCIYGEAGDAMCYECSMVGRERNRL